MGSSRKGSAKPLPYKVLGKKLVHASYNPHPYGMEGFSTVPVRRGWPKDDERYWHAQELKAAMKKKGPQEEDQPTWHYELVYGPPKKK